MDKSRIILTNLNPSVYTKRYLSTFLSEIVINSLLYDEVLIRDGDLITNRNITAHLRDDDNLAVFSELLEVGAVKLLRLSPDKLASNLRFDPRSQPLSARAEDHSHQRSYKGRPWQPLFWEWRLYGALDEILKPRGTRSRTERDSVAYRLQRKFPNKNDFAVDLRKVLLERDRHRLHKHRVFRDIDPDMAKTFIGFCENEASWPDFVRRKGVKEPLLGPADRFFRTAAYQCANVFEHSVGMKRLVESIYAACECRREDADGRYGRSALTELPFTYDSDDEERSAAEAITKIEVVPVSTENFAFRIGPGIGEVVARTRAHPAFAEMQDALRLLGTASDPQKIFNQAWQNLSSVAAENWARKMVRRNNFDRTVGQLAVGVYLALRFLGFVVFHYLPENRDWPLLADETIKNRIEHWTPALSQSIRAMTKIPLVREEMIGTRTLRCTTNNLRAKS